MFLERQILVRLILLLSSSVISLTCFKYPAEELQRSARSSVLLSGRWTIHYVQQPPISNARTSTMVLSGLAIIASGVDMTLGLHTTVPTQQPPRWRVARPSLLWIQGQR